MRICVIFNPAAKGEKAKRFRRQLDAIGADCALKPTAAAGMGRALAAEAVREAFETILAAGGDRTVNEVVKGIGGAPHRFIWARPAGLPLGTGQRVSRE